MKTSTAREANTRLTRRPRGTTKQRRRGAANLLLTLDLCIDELESIGAVSPKQMFDHEAVTVKVYCDDLDDFDDLQELPPTEFVLVR